MVLLFSFTVFLLVSRDESSGVSQFVLFHVDLGFFWLLFVYAVVDHL